MRTFIFDSPNATHLDNFSKTRGLEKKISYANRQSPVSASFELDSQFSSYILSFVKLIKYTVMQNARFEAGEISSMLPKLPTQELEFFLKEIKTIIRKRKKPTKKEEEATLIERLNETGLPKENFERHIFLVKKQRSEGLSEIEKTEMEQLISEEQRLQIARIHILGRLAQKKLHESAKDCCVPPSSFSYSMNRSLENREYPKKDRIEYLGRSVVDRQLTQLRSYR